MSRRQTIRMRHLLILTITLATAPGWLCAAEAPDSHIQTLLETARDGNSDEWNRASDELAMMGPQAKSAVPALIAILRDPGYGNRRDNAIYCLMHIGPNEPAVVDALIDLMPLHRTPSIAKDDEDEMLRNDVIDNIGKYYLSRPDVARRVVPALADLIGDEAYDIYAPYALAEFGPLASPAIDKLAALLTASPDQPATTQPSTLPVESSYLSGRRVWPVTILGRIGPSARSTIPAITNVLKSPDRAEREAAADALARFAQLAKESGPALLTATRDADEKNRIHAAFALGRVKPGDGSPPADLRGETVAETATLRKAFSAGAAGAADPAAAESVAAILVAETSTSTRDGFYRRKLSELGAAALPGLLKCLQSTDVPVRRSAAIQFMEIAVKPTGRSNPNAAAAIEALRASLRDPDPIVRTDAAASLVWFHEADTLPDVLALLKDPDWTVRSNTAFWLREYRMTTAADRTVAALIPLLGDGSRLVRFAAASALKEYGSRAAGAVPALAAALADRDAKSEPEPIRNPPVLEVDKDLKPFLGSIRQAEDRLRVCSAAAKALAAMGTAARPALPELIAAFKSPDFGDRRPLIDAFGAIGPDAAETIPLLVPLVREEGLEFHAAKALGEMGELGAKALVSQLRDKETRFVASIDFRRCGRIAAPAVAAMLGDADPEVRRATAEILRDMGPRARDVTGLLRAQIAKEQDDEARRLEREALEKIIKVSPPQESPSR